MFQYLRKWMRNKIMESRKVELKIKKFKEKKNLKSLTKAF